ncbi:hypothetical protein, partial [Thiolapillus sp.]|uniref:hypothetical protein n=1 Tax=Thiolapillus sp. TaxID=2017437 RepID=UPI003AF46465
MSMVPLSEVCDITAGQSAPQDSDAFGREGQPFIRAGSLDALTNSTLSYFPTPPPTGFCGSLSSPVSLLNKSGELFGCRFWL